MAKLSAYGRTCVVTCYAENRVESSRYVVETRLMSDRKILEKVTIHRADGTKHNWGWKQRAKLIESATPESWVAWMQAKPNFVASTFC